MQLLLLLILFAFDVSAHQSSLTSSGKELKWSNSNVPVTISNTTSDMSSTLSTNIISSAISEWNGSSSAKILQSGSSSNQITFVKNFPYGSAVLGVTEISFNISGSIQRASILLNDDHYFHASPGLYPTGQIYLGDVVTHEMGHLLGLSHSEVLNSTMFYSAFSGQSSVSTDDRTGVRQKYGGSYGTIRGYVKGGSSIGVLGVHVQAISRSTGESSGVVSNESGYFELGGLDLNDTYYLYTSPVKNPESLPGYFSNVQDEFCPASYVGSFFSACGREYDGKPHGITLTDNAPEIDVGTVTINCNLKTDPDYDYQKVQSTFSPLTIFDYGAEDRFEKAFVGWFRKPTSTAWSSSDLFTVDLSQFAQLSGNPKYLKVSLVSYPFGSQLQYEMKVKKNSVTLVTKNIDYSFVTETFNTDFSSLIALGSTMADNIFEIDLKAKKLSSSEVPQTFPSYEKFSSNSYLPFLIVVSLWEDTPTGLQPLVDTEAYLSDNEACLDAPFTYSVSKAQLPSDPTGTAEQALGTGCGTIEPPQDGPGSSLPLFASGFLLSLLAATLIKSRKKFLS